VRGNVLLRRARNLLRRCVINAYSLPPAPRESPSDPSSSSAQNLASVVVAAAALRDELEEIHWLCLSAALRAIRKENDRTTECCRKIDADVLLQRIRVDDFLRLMRHHPQQRLLIRFRRRLGLLRLSFLASYQGLRSVFNRSMYALAARSVRARDPSSAGQLVGSRIQWL
jgi:hypothetical protein